MSFEERIAEDTKHALRAKNELLVSTLRMLSSALHNRAIEKRGKGDSGGLTDEDCMRVLRSEAKKRKDAVLEFEKGGRRDLADKEKKELVILEAYLPAELDDAALTAIVQDVVTATGGAGPKDFGRVMAEAMKRVAGAASGDRVSAIVKSLLG